MAAFLSLWFLFFCPVYILTTSLPLIVKIPASQSFCFTEDVYHHTLVTIKVNSTSLIEMKLSYRNDKLVTMEGKQISKTITTQSSGIHQICLANKASIQSEVQFRFLFGRSAKDYGSTTDNGDFTYALKHQTGILNTFITRISKENYEAFQKSSSRLHGNFLSIYIFMIVFAVITASLYFLQYRVVCKMLHSRKYI